MTSWVSRLIRSETPPDPRGMQLFAKHLVLNGAPQGGTARVMGSINMTSANHIAFGFASPR